MAAPTQRGRTAQCCEETRVTFARSEITANWNPDFDSILDLAEAHGLSPDYSCRSGVCQTCRTRLVEGEVEYDPDPLDSPEEGWVLICCAKPTSNLVLDL